MPHPGRRFAIVSLLMPLGLIVSAVVVLGTAAALRHLAGWDEVDGFETLPQAGFWGSFALFALLGLLVVPQALGVVLGARAWRHGARGVGLAGMLLNAALAVYAVTGELLTVY